MVSPSRIAIGCASPEQVRSNVGFLGERGRGLWFWSLGPLIQPDRGNGV